MHYKLHISITGNHGLYIDQIVHIRGVYYMVIKDDRYCSYVILVGIQCYSHLDQSDHSSVVWHVWPDSIILHCA